MQNERGWPSPVDAAGVRVCFRLHYSNWSGNTGWSLHTSPIFRTNVRAHRPVSSSLANKNIAGRPIFHCVFPYTLLPCYFRYSTRFSCKLSLLSSDQISTFLCVLFFFFFHRLLFRFAENKFPFVDGGEGRYNARTFLSHQGVNRFDSRRESRN